jgi:RNA polymerase sigma factor (sigma-70 family)
MVQQRMSGREQSVEDRVHEVYVITVRAIREGKVREPEHLAGFVRTVAVRQVCDEIRRAGLDRRRCVATDDDAPLPSQAKNPEDLAIENERRERMARTLRSLRPRDREILRRFYLECQTPAFICEEMGLTETQFRLMKSRAKARLTELGRRSIERTKTA